MEFLFSYGTLQETNVQYTVFGRTLSGVLDILEGYRIEWIPINDPVFIATGSGDHQQTLIETGNRENIIKGCRLEITGEELLLADKYEPKNYTRTKVTLRSGNQAWVYIAG